MKKIKSVKYRVSLSYRNSFVFDDLVDACRFMMTATEHPEDPEDVIRFEIGTIVEYEETKPIYSDTVSIKEADKMEIKQKLNSEFGVAASTEEEEYKQMEDLENE